MSYPVVTIFTRKNCGPCVAFMRSYNSFKKDVESICPDAKIHVVTYDTDWKTRIYTENYGIPDLINNKPIPNLAYLESSPMIAVVSSDHLTNPDKYILDGFTYEPKRRAFINNPSLPKRSTRVFLTEAISKVMASKTKETTEIAAQPKTKGVTEHAEKLIKKSSPSSIIIVGSGSGSYGAKNNSKFHFEMVDIS